MARTMLRRKTGCLAALALLIGFPVAAHDVATMLTRARQLLGTTYCHGGTSPSCFDCSGFVRYVLDPYVDGLPRVSRDMARFGTTISRDQLEPGDLLFYATGGRSTQVTHVAIYAGQGSIIHAISNGPNRGVSLTRLDARYWRERFHSAARVVSWSSRETGEVEGLRFARGAYSGAIENGEPNGHGEYRLDNGDRYVGAFRGGVFHGEGAYTWSDGGRYEGGFAGGVQHGAGVYVAANGAATRGTWRDGRLAESETSHVRQDKAPAERTTYLEAEDSPWDTWEGVVEGDFRAWQSEQQRAFEEFLQENR